uniref:hypothetical protein n=1 Tax=Yoonia sp. TaxID=2212373 RepID=UPI00404896D3
MTKQEIDSMTDHEFDEMQSALIRKAYLCAKIAFALALLSVAVAIHANMAG